MTAFVEECRLEWTRLGVPDLLAEEMAAELEADLAEAEADGVSAAELLGESDPRRFAATWASERGLVPERPPAPKQKSRKRIWIGLAVGLVLLGFLLGIGGVAFLAKPKVSAVSREGPYRVQVVPPADLVRVPALVGLRACRAVRIATRPGLETQPHQSGDLPKDAVVDGASYSCDAIVLRQRPAPGEMVPRHGRLDLWLGRASG